MIPTLHTDRLILRPLQSGDFADFYEYAQDPDVAGPGMWAPYPGEDEARQDFTHLLTLYDRGLMWWGIEHRADGKLVGRCELAKYDEDDARAEISYALHRRYWGQGYMYEAAQAVLRHGFATLNLNRVEAIVFPDNQASVRLLERLGMQHEGRLREHRRHQGVFRDLDVYAVLRREWAGG